MKVLGSVGDPYEMTTSDHPLAAMGIAATSFGGAIYGAGQKQASPADSSRAHALATVPVIPGAPTSRHADTLEFLERCHALGAAGIQTHINGDLPAVRKRAEELGMWIEAMFSVRNSTPDQLEQAIADAKSVGCTVARDAMLSGRRYETFNSLEQWNEWVAQTHKLIESVLPVLEKHKFTLAVENHKDWTTADYTQLFKRYSSEYFGACVDLGNNISLLDDPSELVEAAAPFAKATHIKDMAVQRDENGFAMSEVPLGTGILDLPGMFSALTKANPRIHFALEMITRDPLEVPCLSDHYWITFPDRNGLYLARTLRYVAAHKPPRPLPIVNALTASDRAKLETENIRLCFDYAKKAHANS